MTKNKSRKEWSSLPYSRNGKAEQNEKGHNPMGPVWDRIIKVVRKQIREDGKKPTETPWSDSANSNANRLRRDTMAFLHTDHSLVNGAAFKKPGTHDTGPLGIISVRLPRSGLIPMIEANNSIMHCTEIQNSHHSLHFRRPRPPL